MSEPVSTAEIEDVLSSIRRLVSNDVEAAQENAAPEGAADAEPEGKLILTADFRVSEPQDVSIDEAAVEADADEQSEDVVEDESAVEEVVQAEASEDAPLEFHHAVDESPTPEIEAETDAETDEEVVAQVDAQLAQDDANNEVWQDPTEPIVQAEEVGANTSPLEDTIAELEAAIGQQGGEWEPDGSDFEEDADAEEVMSEPVQDWIDGTAKEVVTEAVDEDTQTQTDTAAGVDAGSGAEKAKADLFGDDESVIDEETLRDMVSDIVRQELQGALGERITRNVRKLVRREINRVLAAQDFD